LQKNPAAKGCGFIYVLREVQIVQKRMWIQIGEKVAARPRANSVIIAGRGRDLQNSKSLLDDGKVNAIEERAKPRASENQELPRNGRAREG